MFKILHFADKRLSLAVGIGNGNMVVIFSVRWELRFGRFRKTTKSDY
jgi:hypothetical protein